MDAHVCLYNNVCDYKCRHRDIYLFIPSSPKSTQTERPSLKEVEKLERRGERGREETREEEGEGRKRQRDGGEERGHKENQGEKTESRR